MEIEPAIRAIARADMILDIGGITFSDGREIYLPFNIVTILPAILMRRKTVKCAQAIGPFNHLLNRLPARWILPKLHLILARGSETLQYLQSLGLMNVLLSSDIAFSLPIDDVNRAAIQKYVPKTHRAIFGISPSSVVFKQCKRYHIHYASIIAQFIDILVTQYQSHIIMIPHSMRPDPQKLKNNDLPVIYDIMEKVSQQKHCSVVDKDLSASELRAIIRQCDLFLASRFHAMISGLAEQKPLIVCGWGHKYLEVLEQFQLADYAFDCRLLSLDILMVKFKMLLENETQIRGKMRNTLPQVLQLTNRHFIEIKRLME